MPGIVRPPKFKGKGDQTSASQRLRNRIKELERRLAIEVDEVADIIKDKRELQKCVETLDEDLRQVRNSRQQLLDETKRLKDEISEMTKKRERVKEAFLLLAENYQVQ